MAADPYHFDFAFDDAAALQQLLNQFAAMLEMPLVDGVGVNKPGVYLLYHDGWLVYAGKAVNNSDNLLGRLEKHRLKLDSRINISASEVTCKYLAFDSDWIVEGAERALIREFDPPWNNSGFGTNTPRKSDGLSDWDENFPLKPGVEWSDDLQDHEVM